MRIKKSDLRSAEEKGIIKSSEDLWSFLVSKEKDKLNILNIISIILIISGLLFLHYYCHNTDNQVLSIFSLITVFLILFIISIKKNVKFYSKISKLFSWIILTLTLFRISEYYIIENLSLDNFKHTILIQIISFCIAFLFLIKDNYKNNFLIITLLLFIPFNVMYLENYYKDNIILLFLNFIFLVNLIIYFFIDKKLNLNDNIGFIIFLTGFNLSGILININEKEIFNIIIGYSFIFFNFIFYTLNNLFKKDKSINIFLFIIVFFISFTFNFFDNINFLIIQLILLVYGIYIKQDKIILLSSIFIIFHILEYIEVNLLIQSILMIIFGLIIYAIINIEKIKNYVR